MPEETVRVGGRDYEIVCRDGEEAFLRAAGERFDREARAMLDAAGRMPETRLLLMAGLMLSDQLVGAEERARAQEARIAEIDAGQDRAAEQAARIAELEETVADLRSALRDAEASCPPERVEVPVVPQSLLARIAGFAQRAETLATDMEREAEARGTSD